MRSQGLLNSNPLFFPRVRYIALENVMFLYRWCFTDSEIIELWEERRLLEMQGLRSNVTFYFDAKTHRRYVYKKALNNHGWMRVALGLGQNKSDGAYLFCSAFNSYGEPFEFSQLDAYFDFVRSRQPLELLRSDVEQRLTTDIQRHCEMSKEHLKQRIRKAAKLDLEKQESEFEALSASAQTHLTELREKLRQTSDQSEREALKQLRHDLRQSLLEIESAEMEAIRKSLSDRKNVNLRTVNLFTLAWSVEKG